MNPVHGMKDHFNAEFIDGEIVTITCFSGFNLKGPSRMECKKGDWDVGTISECTPGNIIICFN